jgi:glycosyltransferase involved in cell wall biosynthesis
VTAVEEMSRGADHGGAASARRVVLVVLNDPGSVGLVAPAIEHLSTAGTEVLVAAPYRLPVAESPSGVRLCDLAESAQSLGPAFRRALHAAGPREKLGVYLRNDAWVDHWLPHVDVVLGLDPVAADSARRLVRDRARCPVVATVDEAIEVLQSPSDRGVGAEPPLSVPAQARMHLAEAGSPETQPQLLERARHVVDLAIGALVDGDEARAEAVVRGALVELSEPRLRADLLGDVVSWSLGQGLPVRLARNAYAAELACADERLSAGEYKPAASSFMEAVRTAFHPALHLHHTTSPLADDPVGYTAPLRSSVVAARLRGDGRGGPGRSRSNNPVTRPRRLLLGTHSDPSFLAQIRTHFEAHPDFETRFASFSDTPAVQQFGKRQAPFVAEVLSGGERLPAALEQSFREHLDWADLVFVEWFTATAALLGRMDPGDTRVMVRFHSWEAFSWWPHLVDVRGFDDVVFVSEHLRDFARKAIPGLALADGPRQHVLTNAVDLRRMVLPKSDYARFTLAVVGASRVVKDPRWAVEVVRLLRQHDERYRLVLIRGTVDDEGPATRRYIEDMDREIAALPPGAVEITPHTDDLPTVLQNVGVVISSSVRESFHIGLVEGAASGALPVVRDWPYFSGAAARLFPPDWVVDTPAEAAERILAETSDVRRWRSSTAAAADVALRTWDWSVVQPQYERLFGTTDG